MDPLNPKRLELSLLTAQALIQQQHYLQAANLIHETNASSRAAAHSHAVPPSIEVDETLKKLNHLLATLEQENTQEKVDQDTPDIYSTSGLQGKKPKSKTAGSKKSLESDFPTKLEAAKKLFDEKISLLDCMSEDTYTEETLKLQLLRDYIVMEEEEKRKLEAKELKRIAKVSVESDLKTYHQDSRLLFGARKEVEIIPILKGSSKEKMEIECGKSLIVDKVPEPVTSSLIQNEELFAKFELEFAPKKVSIPKRVSKRSVKQSVLDSDPFAATNIEPKQDLPSGAEMVPTSALSIQSPFLTAQASFPQSQPISLGQPRPVSFPQSQPISLGQPRPVSFPLSQPTSLGQPRPVSFPQSQPTLLGQSRPVSFPQSQPASLSQPQPALFAQQQPALFAQQQLGLFAQQPNSSAQSQPVPSAQSQRGLFAQFMSVPPAPPIDQFNVSALMNKMGMGGMGYSGLGTRGANTSVPLPPPLPGSSHWLYSYAREQPRDEPMDQAFCGSAMESFQSPMGVGSVPFRTGSRGKAGLKKDREGSKEILEMKKSQQQQQHQHQRQHQQQQQQILLQDVRGGMGFGAVRRTMMIPMKINQAESEERCVLGNEPIAPVTVKSMEKTSEVDKTELRKSSYSFSIDELNDRQYSHPTVPFDDHDDVLLEALEMDSSEDSYDELAPKIKWPLPDRDIVSAEIFGMQSSDGSWSISDLRAIRQFLQLSPEQIQTEIEESGAKSLGISVYTQLLQFIPTLLLLLFLHTAYPQSFEMSPYFISWSLIPSRWRSPGDKALSFLRNFNKHNPSLSSRLDLATSWMQYAEKRIDVNPHK